MDNRWNLNDLLISGSFDKDYELLKSNIPVLRKIYQNLNKDMSEEEFRRDILILEDFTEKHSRLEAYALMLEDMNDKDSYAKQIVAKLKDLDNEISEISIKISHFLEGLKVDDKKVLDSKNATRLFKVVPNLEYVLTKKREHAKHSLSFDEENIIQNKDSNGISVVLDLYSLITSEFNYEFKEENGNVIKIPNTSVLTKYVRSNSPYEREHAYELTLDKHKQNIDKLFIVYQAIVKDWAYECKIRKYNSAISRRNSANDIEDDVVQTLIDVCSENVGIYQDFFKLKAKEMGLDVLRRYDIYAPANSKKDEILLDKAMPLVLDTFKSFSDNFYNAAKRIVDSKHIDFYPMENKRGGAYCFGGSREIAPYILLNYTNQFDDVSTIAHELGHGIHDILAAGNYNSSMHPPLTLAETASTFSEALLFDRVLGMEKDIGFKRALLFDSLSDSYATVIRQNYFVKFEIEAHNMISNGTNYEELSSEYFNNLKEQFGSSVSLAENFKYEWSLIPHIFRSPFYCYSYNFGELLSLALYSKYKSEGSDFVPIIEDILSAGGSKNPTELLLNRGINIKSREFWQGSFDIIKQRLKELKSL